jgi:hypothetical protein
VGLLSAPVRFGFAETERTDEGSRGQAVASDGSDDHQERRGSRFARHEATHKDTLRPPSGFPLLLGGAQHRLRLDLEVDSLAGQTRDHQAGADTVVEAVDLTGR